MRIGLDPKIHPLDWVGGIRFLGASKEESNQKMQKHVKL